jgi:hypothetical protein
MRDDHASQRQGRHDHHARLAHDARGATHRKRATRLSFHGRSIGLAIVVTVTGFAAAAPARSDVEPPALKHAQTIRAQVTARYQRVAGRKLRVTEATTTAVVDSLTLMSGSFESSRVVSADDGIYYAICPVRASCPYPARSASLPLAAALPRRQALELALRTFMETPARLVVVALPTANPVWAIFERSDLLTAAELPAGPALLNSDPSAADAALVELVDRLTRPRMYRPIPVLPPSGETIYAVGVLYA